VLKMAVVVQKIQNGYKNTKTWFKEKCERVPYAFGEAWRDTCLETSRQSKLEAELLDFRFLEKTEGGKHPGVKALETSGVRENTARLESEAVRIHDEHRDLVEAYPFSRLRSLIIGASVGVLAIAANLAAGNRFLAGAFLGGVIIPLACLVSNILVGRRWARVESIALSAAEKTAQISDETKI
jgi:hypothetical protein